MFRLKWGPLGAPFPVLSFAANAGITYIDDSIIAIKKIAFLFIFLTINVCTQSHDFLWIYVLDD
jgi:hypothetical protein